MCLPKSLLWHGKLVFLKFLRSLHIQLNVQGSFSQNIISKFKVYWSQSFPLFDLLFFHTQKHTHISVCLGYTLAAAILLLILLGIVAAVFYFVYKPESPKYTVDSIAITGYNLSSSRPISPEFGVSISANNPNDKIGIYYEKKSSIQVYYSDDRLSVGILPVFYQPVNNVTVFKTYASFVQLFSS